MRRIRNPNLAGKELAHRGTTYLGDATGVFDLPDPLADLLLTTPGWAAVGKTARVAAPAEEPAAVATTVVPAAPEATEEPAAESADEATATGPDLTKMTKKMLLAVVEEYSLTLTEEQLAGKVDELRAAVDAALYGATS